MAQPFILPNFNAGELSPALYSRVDLEKYHSGAALVRNFFVDYRGGLSNRTGTALVGRCLTNDFTRLIPFTFSVLQTYALVFGNMSMRVVMDGALVLEPSFAITAATNANPGVFTAGANNFANGDWVFIEDVTGMTQVNGKTYIAQNVPGGHFTLTDLNGNPINTTAFGTYLFGGTVARVFTLSTPYTSADLPLLKYSQSADVMTLTHASYPVQQLTRTQHYAWTLVPMDFGPSGSPPTNVFAVATITGTGAQSRYNYCVTSLNGINGQESLQSLIATCVSNTLSVNRGANVVSWDPVPGSAGYRVYRQMENTGSSAPPGSQFGLIGTVNPGGNAFIDVNSVPDFSQTPPIDNEPFNPNAIETVTVTSGGSGYVAPQAIVQDVQGSGAELAIAQSGGVITSVIVLKPGLGYVNPVIVLSDGTNGAGAVLIPVLDQGTGAINSVPIQTGGTGYSNPQAYILDATGTGAVLTLTESGGGINGVTIVSAGSGYTNPVVIVQNSAGSGAVLVPNLTVIPNYPGCSAYHQERQVFAATTQDPDTLFFSKTADFTNMGYSLPSQPNDSVQATLNSTQVNPIKHLVPLTSLLVLTGSGAWRVDGGTQSDAITPATIDAVPQAYNGCSDVVPIVINYEILYIQEKQSIVRDLSYNFYANIYTGTDISALSAHLFKNHTITDWAYAEEPNKVVWAVRDDGILLSLTFLKEQEVYGWARHDTQGLFKAVCSISEGNENAVYFIVQRLIGGQIVQFIERLASRNVMGGDPTIGIPADITKAWFVDCGLQTPLLTANATLSPAGPAGIPQVASILVTLGGSGYTAPVVTIVDEAGSGTGATAAAVLSGGVITGITVLTPGANYVDAQVIITDPTGSGAVAWAVVQNLLTFNTDNAVFSNPGSIGLTLQSNGARGTIVTVLSPTSISVNLTANPWSVWPQGPGAWSATPPVTSISGLDHLDGETVSILADGNAVPRQVVVNGSITLTEPATNVTVGLPIQAQFQSLYLATGSEPTDQGKRKKVTAATMRLVDSRGLKIGRSFSTLVSAKELGQQILMGQPIPPLTGDERVIMAAQYDVPGQVCIQLDDPLPCTLTGLVPEVTIGDSP